MNFIKIILLLCFYFISGCSPIKNLYVPFSKAKSVHQSEDDNVIRIYFDRMGFIYPDIEIEYKDFKNNDGRLNRYYNNNRNVYEDLCRTNNLKPYTGNLDEVDPSIEPLQGFLIDYYLDKINTIKENQELVFIIHGYNEYPLEARDKSSFFAMKRTREEIRKRYKRSDIKFVEIYWDGLSQEGGSKILSPANSIKIWNNAQASATNTGLELRRMLSKIQNNDFVILTHSHGAGVITTSLFNVEKFRNKLYQNPDNWLFGVKKKYQNKIYDTPNQNIKVGMLAPAIPGVNVFDEYYHRTVNGKEVFSEKANFRFLVGFNENDPVTSKFKIAAKKLGSTTLACKADELLRTENLFDDPQIIDYTNFSTFSNGKLQDDHSWLTYLSNDPNIETFIFELMENR